MTFGPIPPESNPPITPQYYNPSQFFISAITRGYPTVVTTSVDHNYYVGQEVRTILGSRNGCRGLQNRQSLVIGIPTSTTLQIGVDTSQEDAFVLAPVGVNTSPQIVAIGDNNSGAINNQGRTSTLTYILGSFINVSPN